MINSWAIIPPAMKPSIAAPSQIRIGKREMSAQQKRRAEDDERDRKAETEENEKRRAFRGGGDRDDIVERHHCVGDDDHPHGAEDRCLPGDGLLPRSSRASFTAIQSSRRPPTRLMKGTVSRSTKSSVNTTRSPIAAIVPSAMPLKPLRLRQARASERDDDGIVARKKNVDPDDLKDRDQKVGRIDGHAAARRARRAS